MSSFRLKDDESVQHAVSRIARHEIDAMRAQLRAGPARREAIHEARKSSKKLRAVVRLMRDAIGEKSYRRENATLRDAVRPLRPCATPRPSCTRSTCSRNISRARFGRAPSTVSGGPSEHVYAACRESCIPAQRCGRRQRVWVGCAPVSPSGRSAPEDGRPSSPASSGSTPARVLQSALRTTILLSSTCTSGASGRRICAMRSRYSSRSGRRS